MIVVVCSPITAMTSIIVTRHRRHLISQGYHKPLEKFMAELDKCDLVCAVCHRIRGYRNTAIRQKLCKPRKRDKIAKSPMQRQRECRARKVMQIGDKPVSFYSTST